MDYFPQVFSIGQIQSIFCSFSCRYVWSHDQVLAIGMNASGSHIYNILSFPYKKLLFFFFLLLFFSFSLQDAHVLLRQFFKKFKQIRATSGSYMPKQKEPGTPEQSSLSILIYLPTHGLFQKKGINVYII